MTLLTLMLFATQALQFEVATIKPTPPAPGANFEVSAVICHGVDNHNKLPTLPAGVPALGRCMVTNVGLRAVISAAYSASGPTMQAYDRVVGGPRWIDTEPYNIEGKVEDPSTATEAELKSMLQQLLVERFKLQFHTETKEGQGYALVVAKGGPKLKPGTGDVSMGFRYSGGSMSATNTTMDTLAQSLTGRIGGLVTNQTGLTGSYAITLPGNISNDPNGTSASSALQELGLTLEPQKVRVEIIVIDRIEKPIL